LLIVKLVVLVNRTGLSAVLLPTVMLREKVAKDVQRVDGGGKTRKDNRVDDDLVQFVGS
jgi:hypothetical protein